MKTLTTIALAMMLILPSTANAAEWVRYTFYGTGTERLTSPGPTEYTRPVDFSMTFSVDVEPTDGVGSAPGLTGYTSTGSDFYAIMVGGYLRATATAPGSLTVTHSFSFLRNVTELAIDGRFEDVDGLPGLPIAGAAGIATGAVSFTRTGPGIGGQYIVGSLTRFAAERTTGYEALSVVAVPEVTTWAMMIVGAGAVGGTMRRAYAAKAVVCFA